jgi:hypothetical protein
MGVRYQEAVCNDDIAGMLQRKRMFIGSEAVAAAKLAALDARAIVSRMSSRMPPDVQDRLDRAAVWAARASQVAESSSRTASVYANLALAAVNEAKKRRLVASKAR